MSEQSAGGRQFKGGAMTECPNGADLGHSCRLCGEPLLSCWDDGPSISWHADPAAAAACATSHPGKR